MSLIIFMVLFVVITYLFKTNMFKTYPVPITYCKNCGRKRYVTQNYGYDGKTGKRNKGYHSYCRRCDTMY